MFRASTRTLTIAALMLGTTCLAPSLARADSTDDLLNTLKAKGILTQAEVDQLKARKASEAPPAPVAVPAAAAPSGDATYVRAAPEGIGVVIGPVTAKVSGEINGFFVYDSPQNPGANTAVAGGLAAVGSKSTSSVRNGLLPENLNLDLTTKQEGVDIDVRFGIYPGLNSTAVGALNANNGGNPVALGTSGVDFRQAYVSAGTPSFGTVKIGRDIGLYGQEAILGDITLLGVGSPAGNGTPGNTSLGRIGLGYIYTDFMPQIEYTSPKLFGGLQISIAVLQPLNGLCFSGAGCATSVSNQSSPQFQGKISYVGNIGDTKLHLWANGVSQEASAVDTLGASHSFTGYSFDFGAQVTAGMFSVLGYGYTGDGVGTTGLFFDAVSAAGTTRGSSGFIGQGQVNFGKFALSGSYGASYLDLANGEVNPSLVKTNESEVFQGLYHLTSWDSLVAEFIHTTATSHGGNSASDNGVALGTIVFF